MAICYIRGSHGTLDCDACNGDVVDYNKEGDEDDYSDIVRVNVEEWCKTYPDEDIEGKSIDILDIGSWTKDGEYCEPEADYRNEIKLMKKGS